MSYLLLTIAGIGHKDLLLNSDITLPILQVKIELTRFFLFAPLLLVLIHAGLVSQLVLLARKTLEFAAAIRMLETTEQRTHPLRLELDNFFFVQAIAGPERSRIVGFFLHGMSWLTLVVMPVHPPALRTTRLPALSRRRHHLGASPGAAGRHRPAGVHRRVPLALGDVVLPSLLANEPASSHRPHVHGGAAHRRGGLLALGRHQFPARPSRVPRGRPMPGAPAISWAMRCRASASLTRAPSSASSTAISSLPTWTWWSTRT